MCVCGLEPVCEARNRRRIWPPDGGPGLRLPAVAAYMHGGDSLPPAFIDAHALAPAAHLQMQVAIQPYSDNAIAKTINTPADLDFAAYRSVFESGYAMGLKGCTMFRPNPVTGSALSSGPEADVRHTVVTSRTRPASRRSIFR